MKLFKYVFADGAEIETSDMTNAFMSELVAIHGKCIFNGFRDQLETLHLLRANSHSRGDGFKPGYHPGLGMEIRSHEQYQKELKSRGLVEVGNEKRKEEKVDTKVFTEDIIKEAVQAGADISGQEAKMLLGEA